MYLNKIKLFLVISFFLSSFFLTLKDVKSYEIKVVDGDTIHLNGKKIRFSGIDTPELKQTCSKNNQISNLQDNTEKSALPNDEKISSNDLDDEIPF